MAKPKTTPPKNGGSHGGKRSRAGRPRAELTKARDDFDAQLNALIAPDLRKLYAAARGLALGVHAERELDGKKVVVYVTLPDFKALSYLLDRIAGKPKQAVTLDAGRLDLAAAVGLTEQAATSYRDPDDDAAPATDG